MCKMIISPSVFFIFSKSWFFGFLDGKSAKNCPKWQKILCHAPYLRNHISYDCHLWYTCVNFLVIRGVKGQKMVQNDKKICPLCLISQGPYIIWLSFMVQMCKMIISPVVFFNFKILIFWVVRGLKGQKMAQNDKKFCLSHSVSQEPYIIWLWFLVHMCKMIISPATFFIFQNFDFWCF